MANVVFFSFTESDREVVLTIKGRAVNPRYTALNFRVKDLLRRWDTEDVAVIRQAISKAMKGTSRTIVFVGDPTHALRARENQSGEVRANSAGFFGSFWSAVRRSLSFP